MKTKILIFAIFIFSIVTTFTACNKDKKTTPTNQTGNNSDVTSQNEAVAQMTFEGVDQIADEAYTSFSSLKSTQSNANSLLSACATKTIDTVSIPHTLTINYGTTNCLCYDGKYRRGEIVISYYLHYRDSGSVHSTTFNDYYVNDNHVMGTRSRVNNGRNAAGNWNITTTVNGTIIFANNTDTLTWNSTQNKEWLQGYLSSTIWDNIVLITGNSNGTRPNGTTYSKTILTPLKRQMPCFYFVSGTVQVVQSNKPTKVIDYGNGNCDAWATVTINGVTYNIHL
ncbi:MAG: hypothetical protein WCL51_15480 [Bacteroidota bacterium]